MKKVKLPPTVKLRQYQLDFRTTVMDLIQSNPEKRHLFSSPTGTGKSIMELDLLQQLPGGLFVTPRLEIVQGMLEKLNDFDEDETKEQTIERAWQYGIITPIRLRNLLAKGDMPFYPNYLIWDECHHSLADSWRDVEMYLNGVPTIGLTATPYRGTPQGTQEFYERWNNTVNQILSLEEAVQSGYCSMPTAEMIPLVDDDTVSLTNGEFKVASVDAVVFDRIKYLCEFSRKFYCTKQKLWDRPTMFSVSSSAVAHKLTKELNDAGLSAECVTQETSTRLRREIFKRVIDLRSALVQIDVISEGVDLPIRRLIDIRPTMSPVKWVQQIGRIMRPVQRCDECKVLGVTPGYPCECEPAPEYICCCRNLERHAYLMEGMFPNSTIKEAQEAFTDAHDNPIYTKRGGNRAVGMEGLGKFTTTPVSLTTGVTVYTYHLIHTDQFTRKEYFAIVHPNNPNLTIGVKESAKKADGSLDWGKWRLIEAIPDVKGCVSAKANTLTPNQMNYWNGAAASKGLNIHQPLTNRVFSILPFLRNTGLSFQ